MRNFGKGIVAVVLVLLIYGLVLGQDDTKKEPKLGWNNNVVGSLNLTQTNFDNWSQGGENSLTWQLNGNAKFDKNEPKYNWTSTGKIAYGRLKIGNQGSRKSVDEIRLGTVYTYKLDKDVNPYASATGETQFSKGYDYSLTPPLAISNFMDPGYFTQSVGLEYSPGENFDTRLGAALRETITNKYNQYTDNPNTPKIEKTKTEAGVESVTDFSFQLAQNMLLTSDLRMFSNLKAINQVVLRWDNILSAKVAKYADVNFNFQIFYDSTISKKRQMKEALSLGLTYTFL